MRETPTLTFVEAAERVLSESPGGGPLHFRDISRQAMAKGYLRSSGKTPWQSMGAQLYMAIKSDSASGRAPRFVQAGKGLFSLPKRRSGDNIQTLIDEARKQSRLDLLERLKAISPRRFEQLVGDLLLLIGFEDIEVTGKTGDKGIDAVGRLTVGGITNVSTAIQAKRWKGTVGGKIIREMRGSLQVGQRGTIITTATFTRDAIEEASAEGKEPISLIDGEKLIDLMFKNQLAVRRRQLEHFELDLEVLDEPLAPETSDDDETGEDESEDSTRDSRVASLFPLPGGTDDYLDVLLRILRQAGVEGSTREELKAWFFKEFPNVESEKTVQHTLQTLRAAGFLSYDGELLKPSEEALELFRNPKASVVIEILRDHVIGIAEILDWLHERPQSKAELYARLCKEFPHLRWGTDTQVRIRLTWLIKLGVVESCGGCFRLCVSEGRPPDERCV